MLSLYSAWPPSNGGIAAFNRALLTAFAAAGHPTACLVEAPLLEDVEDAALRGVKLFAAERAPDGPWMVLDSPDVRRFRPAIVIGHDRFTGAAAWVHARRYNPDALLVHIVHTAPAELERFKHRPEATARAEEREGFTRRIAADADVVAAVGPRLARYAADLMEGCTAHVQVVRLDPGLGPLHAGVRHTPPKPQVLMLGRTRDLDLKGFDIAAKAVAAVPMLGSSALGLLVRGAPREECDSLHRELVALSGLARELLDVRAFTTDPAELRRDLLRSIVCVVPSRVEGFGLVALDAIAAGTPLLVSAKSGAAELLRDRLGLFAEPMIVNIADQPDEDVYNWSVAIGKIVAAPEASLRYAEEVRQRLAGRLTWAHTVEMLLDAIGGVEANRRSAPALVA